MIFPTGGLSWTRVQIPRLLSLLAKLLYGSAILAILDVIDGGVDWVQTGQFLGLLVWPIFLLSYILSLNASSFPGRLEISPHTLVIEAGLRRRSIARAKIAGALVGEVSGSFLPTVEIELTNGDILTARMPDADSAQAVVRALGFAAGGKRVHASLATPGRRLLHPVLGLFAVGIGFVAANLASDLGEGLSRPYAFDYALRTAATLIVYALLKRLLRAPELTVGDDGVLVKGKLRTRFIPRGEIAFITTAPTSIAIEKHGGERVVIGGVLLDGARRKAVARAIEERAGVSAAAAHRFAHYERAGRPVAAWREHLAHALEEGGYRENAATVDEAEAVLRSAQATPEQRVGAALALRVAGQPSERIRVAAGGAADERAREALEAVAEAEDDVVLEKALRRLVV